jgi:hypothetical protein
MNPTEQLWGFMGCLIGLRKGFMFSVSSWLRTPRHNAAVGGKVNSKHLWGLGVDVVLDPGEDRGLFLEACRIAGLTTYPEGDHIHVQALPVGVEPSAALFTISKAPTPPAGGKQGGVPLPVGGPQASGPDRDT